MKDSRAILALAALTAAIISMFTPALSATSAPPVRIAIVAGNGSGMEQEVVDHVSDQLASNNDIKVSTVNPDWTAVVNIVDKTDNIALTVRVNGTITVKTRDGHVIDTISMQTNKQDFNVNNGVPSPLNKALVDSAAREVIDGLTQRAINPISDAVATEMDTRTKIIQANDLADQDKYADALDLLKTISPDTPHFRGARELMAEFQMEQEALDLMNRAKANAHAGRISSAISELRAINAKSKRYGSARQMIASFSRSGHLHSANGDDIKTLEQKKQALGAQMKAIDAQEAAIKMKPKD